MHRTLCRVINCAQVHIVSQVAQRNNKPVVVLDSDSSGSDTDTESFQVTRNESQIMAVSQSGSYQVIHPADDRVN